MKRLLAVAAFIVPVLFAGGAYFATGDTSNTAQNSFGIETTIQAASENGSELVNETGIGSAIPEHVLVEATALTPPETAETTALEPSAGGQQLIPARNRH
jgi:hypothetical protein